jgi:hypothetical protein
MGTETCPQWSGTPEHRDTVRAEWMPRDDAACVIFVGIATVEAAGRELRHKRVHERRLTQEQLAGRLGISGR